MSFVNLMTAARDLVYFDEERYLKRNSETTDTALSMKLEKKSLQLVACGGGIGAGLVATLFTGPTSILASALSARHANVLRQQQKLLGQIQRLRRKRWLYELAAGYQAASNQGSTPLEKSIIDIAVECEIFDSRYPHGIPRMLSSSPQCHLRRITSCECDKLSPVQHSSPPAGPGTEEKPHSAA
ncbi:hypothetical protein M408DRAFT_233434 [Serendipita vermifera MAFF 305830]|uniref:Uncharacterized protein n=1 Tax=Serendipita vermifera MAFF 305830 TaxID=933852 RepID=A0A0C3AYR1_SERVB|nr:hypothetical protein M408DRAFT_233434 [Serendipita vermifera MAFF 305830]